MSTIWKAQLEEVVRELQALARGRAAGIVGVTLSAPTDVSMTDLKEALLRRLRLDDVELFLEPMEGPMRVLSVEFGRRAGSA